METLSFANSCLNSARNVGNQTLSTWLKLWLWWSTNLCADVEALWWLQSLCLISWRWNFFSSLNRWVRCGIYRLMRCNHVILLIRFKLSMWFWITWKKICYIQKLGFRLNYTINTTRRSELTNMHVLFLACMKYTVSFLHFSNDFCVRLTYKYLFSKFLTMKCHDYRSNSYVAMVSNCKKRCFSQSFPFPSQNVQDSRF